MEREFFPQRAFALFSRKKVGVYSDEVTPVPIPNTEVKLINVDDTWLATTRESRTMPTLYLIGSLYDFRFFIICALVQCQYTLPAQER